MTTFTGNAMKALCPRCGVLLDATESIEDGHVYCNRTCPEHGSIKTLVSADAEYWKRSLRFDRPGMKPVAWSSSVEKGCPDDCGICPQHKQHTCVGIIEITGKCNLECNICFASSPSGGHLDLETIKGMIDAYVSYEANPEILQLSGGEPTLHPDLFEIIGYAKALGIEDVALSTNGLRLLEDEYARELASTGPVIYLQFDTLESEVSKRMRGRDLVDSKRQIVEVCNKLGMTTVLVPTIIKGYNTNEVGAILDYAMKQEKVFGVNFQPVAQTGRVGIVEVTTIPEMLQLIGEQTNGRIKASDFRPIPCPHPHCTAISYLLVEEGEVTPLTDIVDVDEYIDYARDRTLVKEAVLMDEAFRKLFSTRAVPGSEGNLEAFCEACGITIPDALKKSVKIVSVHSFMDRATYQLERAQKCCIHVIQPDGKMIPFCNFNMFHRSGA